jgi:hypothetical protein
MLLYKYTGIKITVLDNNGVPNLLMATRQRGFDVWQKCEELTPDELFHFVVYLLHYNERGLTADFQKKLRKEIEDGLFR